MRLRDVASHVIATDWVKPIEETDECPSELHGRMDIAAAIADAVGRYPPILNRLIDHLTGECLQRLSKRAPADLVFFEGITRSLTEFAAAD